MFSSMLATPTRTTPTTGRRPWAALAVLTLAVVLLAVDATVLALAVPALTADLGPTATQLLWIGDIYSFALAGLLITMGNVADRIGRKRLLLIGSVGFGISSALAALASTPELLIAARALLGISGATLMPSTLSIVRNLFDEPRQRTRAIAVWSAGATGGAAVGPLVGGTLLEHFSWGAVFLINIPVVAVIVVAGAILLPESRNPARPRIDLISAVLSIGSIVPLVYAVKHVVGSGLDLTVAVAAAIGVASAVAFVRRQHRMATPLLDLSLFRIPAFGGAVAANTLAIFAFSGLLFFFSQYLQLVRGYRPLHAGLAELPLTLASLAVIGLVGIIVARLGAGRAIGSGLGLAAAGLALLALAEGFEGYLGIGIALVTVGLGIGVAMTLSTDAVVTAAPPARAGAAAAISETGYELGVALGIALLGTLQSVLYRAWVVLPGNADPATRTAVGESLAAALRAVDPTTPVGAATIAQAQHAFTAAMQVTAVTAAVLLAVAAVIAWRVVPSVPRRQDGV